VCGGFAVAAEMGEEPLFLHRRGQNGGLLFRKEILGVCVEAINPGHELGAFLRTQSSLINS
jgi:hypothetical protein